MSSFSKLVYRLLLSFPPLLKSNSGVQSASAICAFCLKMTKFSRKNPLTSHLGS